MERKEEGVWIQKQIEQRIRRGSSSRGDVENHEFRGKKLWSSKETCRFTRSKPNSNLVIHLSILSLTLQLRSAHLFIYESRTSINLCMFITIGKKPLLVSTMKDTVCTRS